MSPPEVCLQCSHVWPVSNKTKENEQASHGPRRIRYLSKYLLGRYPVHRRGFPASGPRLFTMFFYLFFSFLSPLSDLPRYCLVYYPGSQACQACHDGELHVNPTKRGDSNIDFSTHCYHTYILYIVYIPVRMRYVPRYIVWLNPVTIPLQTPYLEVRFDPSHHADKNLQLQQRY